MFSLVLTLDVDADAAIVKILKKYVHKKRKTVRQRLNWLDATGRNFKFKHLLTG